MIISPLNFYRRSKQYLADFKYKRLCRIIAHEAKSNSKICWASDIRTHYWAHAGSGKLHIYGNSQEAFDDAIARGYGVIEADIMMTSDGFPVMSHRYRPNNEIAFDKIPTLNEFMSHPVNDIYTPMSLLQFIERYKNANVFFSLDPSPDIRSDHLGVKLINYLEAHSTTQFLRKIIYQINGLDQLMMFGNHNPFGALHYNIDTEICGSSNRWKIPLLIPALDAVGVGSVSISDFPIDNTNVISDIIVQLHNHGIEPVIVGVNSNSRQLKWQNLGVKCFNTDKLSPKPNNSGE